MKEKKRMWNYREFPEDPEVTALMTGFEIQYMITGDTVEENEHHCVFGHCVFPPHSMHGRHGHTRSAEIIYVIRGQVTSGYVDENGNDVEEICTEGSSTYTPPNVTHWVNNPFEEEAEFVFVYTCAHSIPDSGYYDVKTDK